MQYSYKDNDSINLPYDNDNDNDKLIISLPKIIDIYQIKAFNIYLYIFKKSF